MSKHLSFLLPVKLFLLTLLLPALSWGQCINPVDLVDNTLEICQGEEITFCPEVDEYCWKWLPEYAFPGVEETLNTQPTTISLEEDVVIQLIKTSDEGDLIEEIEINVLMKNPDFTVELEEVYGVCLGGSVTIDPVITGGGSNLSYDWSSGESTASITVSSEETTTGYEILVTDLNTGCSVIASTYVEIRNTPEFIIEADADFICQQELPTLAPPPPSECESESTIRLSVSLEGDYDYEWTDPSGATFDTEDLMAEFEGRYQLTISDSELGCTGMAEYFIRSCASVSIDAEVTIENSEIAFILSAQTGENYTYTWKNSEGTIIGTAAEISVFEPGTYKVEARSPAGCLVEDTYIIQLPCTVPKDNNPETPDEAYYVYTPGGVGILLPEGMPIEFEQSSSGKLNALFDEHTKKLYNGLTTNFFQGYLYNGDPTDDYENGDFFEGINYIYQGEVAKIEGECKCRIFQARVGELNVYGTSNGVPTQSSQIVDLNYRPINPSEVIVQNTSAYHCMDVSTGGAFSGDDYMDLIMDNDPGSNVYNELDFLQQLYEVRDYLTEKDQKAAFYYYDRNAGVLRIYGRSDDPNNGIVTVAEESEIQAILAALHSGNLPAGKDFVGIFDRQAVDVIRFEPKFGQGTFKAAEGPWPELDDSEYEDVSGTALKNTFNRLDDANSFVYDPYDESGDVAWDGELRMEDGFGFLKWSTFGFNQLSHLVKNGEVDTKIWNNDPANLAAYNEQPLHIWTSAAGVVDQGAVEYKDLKETVVLMGKVYDDPKGTLQPMYEGVRNLTFDQVQKMAVQTIQGLQGNTAEAQHKRAEAGTGAVVQTFKMASGGGGLAILAGISAELFKRFRKFIILLRKFDNLEVTNNLKALPDVQAQKFADDFENIIPDDIAKFNGNPGLVDKWRLSLDSDFPDAWRGNTDFLESLRNVMDYTFVNGRRVKLPNIMLTPTSLTKVTTAAKTAMKRTFNSTGRKNFLKDLGNNPNITTMLQKAGFTDAEIPNLVQKLKNGQGITNYQVHHKVPVALGGNNDFSNLVLMKQNPFHSAMTSFQNSQINIPVGQTQILDFPNVPGSFYSPPYIE